MAIKPIRVDSGLNCGAGSPSWQGGNGVGGVYYKTGVGLVARRADNTEVVLNSPCTLYSNATPIASATSGEIDAHVYTMPANTIFADGQRLQVIMCANRAANSNSTTYRLYIAGTQLIGQIRTTSAETEFYVLIIVRQSTTTWRWHATIVNGAGLTVATNAFSMDSTVPNVIKTSVEGLVAAGDLTARFTRVEFWP